MSEPRLRTAVLISGGGSNLQALIDACAEPAFPAEIALVISNIPEAFGLQRAARSHIPTEIVNHRHFPDRTAFEAALHATLEQHCIQFVCLAGFMRILGSAFVERWEGRMLNIHPSLLPAYKGLHTHQRALEDGAAEAGCTVHWVSAGVDEGEILMQARVPVLPGDTAETLAARVLKEEHRIYPDALRQVAQTELKT